MTENIMKYIIFQLHAKQAIINYPIMDIGKYDKSIISKFTQIALNQNNNL